MSVHRSPVDLVHPKTSETAGILRAGNLAHPVKYGVTSASRNHVTLAPRVGKGRHKELLPHISGLDQANLNSS